MCVSNWVAMFFDVLQLMVQLEWTQKLVALIQLGNHFVQILIDICVCAVCDKRLAAKTDLQRHLCMHSEQKSYFCSQCDQCFHHPRSLRHHMNIHGGKYKCSECGKCFATHHDLTTHGRFHSWEKPFESSVCGKRFRTEWSLTRHGRIHSGEKPYKCNVCQKAFRRTEHQTSHMRVHTGEKPCVCHVCQRAFSDSGSLNSHVRIHTGDKPFKCPLCDKGFRQCGTLQSHKRSVHSKRKPYYCLTAENCSRQLRMWRSMPCSQWWH